MASVLAYCVMLAKNIGLRVERSTPFETGVRGCGAAESQKGAKCNLIWYSLRRAEPRKSIVFLWPDCKEVALFMEQVTYLCSLFVF